MADDVQQPMPAKLGRYEIVRELGRGGMGVVYEGFDPLIQRRVAIKTALRSLLATASGADDLLARFLREAPAAGALNHPNIITIYDTGEENGTVYIAMEFIDGGTLDDRMSAGQRWDPAEVVELGAVIAEALAAAHEVGIIHRDVKPANIMLPTRGPAKLADFGIAHVSNSTLTHQGDLIGTPYYMSPEQFMAQKVDGRADLFSLAIILYEMLTGEKPFRGQAVNTIMHEVLKSVPTPPDQLNYSVTTCLSQVLLKGLEKSPLNRYQNGLAFAAALRASIKDNPDPAIIKISTGDATMVDACTTKPPIAKAALEATELGPPVVPEAAHNAIRAAGEPGRFHWSRKYTVAAGALAVALIASAAILVPRGPEDALGNTKDADAAGVPADYYGPVLVQVYGVTGDCYDAFEAATDKDAVTCYEFDLEPGATIYDANNPADRLDLQITAGTAKIDLSEKGKRWANYKVRLTHPKYETLELGPLSDATDPAEIDGIKLYMIGSDVQQRI